MRDIFSDLTKLQINTYMKLVFEKQYNKNYIDLFTDRYINIRYYNFYENVVYCLGLYVLDYPLQR